MRRPSGALLDRDGTLNTKAPEGEYVVHPDALVLLPGAAAAVRALNQAAVPALLVTNQRGVARGLMTAADLDAVQERLAALLAAEGAHLDGWYACPHEPGCDCRKPLPGLARRAAAEHGLDLGSCAVIGDAASDVGLARAVGATAVRLASGPDPSADATAPDVAAAVALLLAAP